MTVKKLAEVPSPCYVLNETSLLKNLAILDYVQQQAGCTIICALKGFAMFATFKTLRKHLGGGTASSLNEAKLIVNEMECLAHTYSPAYLQHEFGKLMQHSSHITFNSLNQWELYKKDIKSFDKHIISCGIRINPQYSEVSTDMYNPCIAGSRLGVTRNQLGSSLPNGIEGLHFHTLCENDSFTLERTLQVIEQHFGDLLHQVKWLNMGGGHHITRSDYDVEHLIQLIKRIKNTYKLEVILEPGEAIGWQTGVLRSTVLDIIDSQGINVAILDISFAAHMPDCLEMPYKPNLWGASDVVVGKPTYRIGGLTCLAGDFVGDYSFDNPLKVGDTIIFDDMIHYTMVKTTTFNGVNLPSIGMFNTNNEFILLRTYGYESYKDRLG